MLDWFKFFPFARGNAPKATEIRGPYFPTPRENKWVLGDSVFRFSAPWANPVFGFSRRGRSVDAVHPGATNILDANDLEPTHGSPSAPPSPWDHRLFYHNSWYFVGPWFTGEKASLTANGLLITAREHSSFAEVNLFNPRGFESAIASFLDYLYGYKKDGTKPYYRGPLNWRVLPLSPTIQGVLCDVHSIGDATKDNPLLYRMVFIPVSQKQFIRINFNFGDVEIYRDSMRAQPLFNLCDPIIDSMRMDVGETTLVAWDEAMSPCPDMTISESFCELPWPLTKEEVSKKAEFVDVTPSTESQRAMPIK